MRRDAKLSPTDRLLALWEYLGLRRAHVASPIPGDLAQLASGTRSMSRASCCVCPAGSTRHPSAEVADRVLMIGAERGPSAEATARGAAVLPAAKHMTLNAYDAPGSWADAVADRGDEIARR